MGIYIEGMDMPKDDCEAYRQIIITNNLVDGKIQILAHDANTNEFIGEVVELPSHGRLIDVDTVILENGPYEYEEWCKWALDQYLNAPAIIPASNEKS